LNRRVELVISALSS